MALNFLNNGYFAGKVGIGVEGPGAVLGVRNPTAGSSTLSLQHSTSSSIFDFQTGIANVTGNALVIKDVANSYNYLTLRDDNVGIGTINPNSKLEVFKSGGTVFNVLGSLGQLFSVTDNLSGEIFAVADISGVPIMSINSNGKVGIGTSSPATGLDIQTSYKQLTLGNTTGTQSGAMQFRRGGDGQILAAIGYNGATDGNVFVAGLIGGGGAEFRLTSGNATSSVVTISTASGEAMRVLGTNNNVGIKTTLPGSTLQVGGLDDGSDYDITLGWNAVDSQAVGTKRSAFTFKTAQTSVNDGDIYKWDIAMLAAPATVAGEEFGSDLAFLRSTRDSTAVNKSTILLSRTGNVGIGQDVPVNSLDVYRATGDASIRIQAETASDSTILKFRNQNSDADITVDQTTSNRSKMVFTTDNTSGYVPVLSLEANRDTLIYGNLGINDTSPDFRLDVGGTLGVSDLPFNTTSVSVLVANETIGAELVTGTNSNMSGANSWINNIGTLTFDINTTVSDRMYCDFTTGNQQVILPNTLTAGKSYLIKLTARLNSGTATIVQLGGFSSNQAGADVFNITPTSTTTTYKGYITVGSDTNLSIGIITANNNGSDYEFGTVSAKEIISASDQIQKRELGPDAFGPGTGTGPYLPLTGGTLTGNLTISNASPALNLTDTDNSSNIAFSSVGGALIVNSPSDQVYQLAGTEKFRIASSTATFAGSVTLVNEATTTSSSELFIKGKRTDGTDGVFGEIIFSNNNDSVVKISSVRDTADNKGALQFATQNGASGFGTALTLDSSQNATFAGLITATKSQNATSSFAFQNLDTTGTSVRTHLTATAGNRSIRLEAIHSDYSYVASNNARMYLQTNDGSNNTLLLDGDNATFAGTVSGTTATFTTFSGDLDGTINTATTAFTQANAVDNTTVATTAYVNNKIQLIPAGLIFQGTWDARTTAEGGAVGNKGNPALTSGVGTTGNFYIVSNAGSVNLDGITDWKVGDWAVFIEQGASDQWEKIDNSSVLDGFGTGQSVTKWDGSGTSNTLTDGPITFSTNDSTFTGDVGIGVTPTKELQVNGEALFGNGTDGLLLSYSGTNSSGIIDTGHSSTALEFRVGNTQELLINSTSATFAGDVIVKTALLSNQEDLEVDIGTETIANVAIATYTAAFFDFVIKKGLNVRSGTVYACHNGDTVDPPLVQFTETSTQDLGDTSDVVLSVDISGTNMRLLATVTSNDWIVKSLIRAI